MVAVESVFSSLLRFLCQSVCVKIWGHAPVALCPQRINGMLMLGLAVHVQYTQLFRDIRYWVLGSDRTSEEDTLRTAVGSGCVTMTGLEYVCALV